MACCDKKWIKVATYNVWHCGDYRLWKVPRDAGNKDIVNTDNVGEFMYRYGIEICTLNEMMKGTYVSDYKDQAEEIARYMTEKTGEKYYSAFGEAAPQPAWGGNPAGGSYGNAIVSKYPIKNVQPDGYIVKDTTLISIPYEERIEGVSGYETRALVKAVLDVDGKELVVMTGHFGLVKEERQKAVEAVRDALTTISGPALLMGDFNARPDSEEYDAFAKLMVPTAAKEDLPFTFPTGELRVVLDYILHTPDVVSKDLKAIPEVISSDHIPLTATIGMPM